MAQTRQIKKLDELMDGALTERFNYEMERVLNNVFDQNTNPKASARSRSSLTSFRMSAAMLRSSKSTSSPRQPRPWPSPRLYSSQWTTTET